MEQYWNMSQHRKSKYESAQKMDPGEENSPTAPARTWMCYLSIISPALSYPHSPNIYTNGYTIPMPKDPYTWSPSRSYASTIHLIRKFYRWYYYKNSWLKKCKNSVLLKQTKRQTTKYNTTKLNQPRSTLHSLCTETYSTQKVLKWKNTMGTKNL